MKNSNLTIGSETIYPGEKLSLAMPLPEIFSCAPMHMPIKVIHGKNAGPCLLVTAAMHGNELNGTEIINRLVNTSALKNLNGTLIAVPVMNVNGFINRDRYLPGGFDLDRYFPGKQNGTNAERLAYLFTSELFSKADVCLDLQTGHINYTNLPQILVNFDDEKSKSLAKTFNAPVISHQKSEKGSFRAMASKSSIPFLTYEAGEAMRFDEYAIKIGVRGILNLLRKLEMLPEKKPRKENHLKSFFTDKNIWLRAPTSGISRTKHKLGQHVKKGDILCHIQDPFGAKDDVKISCPEEAIIVGKSNLPLVHEGEALFQLAIFPKMQHIAPHLEEWKNNSHDNFNQVHKE